MLFRVSWKPCPPEKSIFLECTMVVFTPHPPGKTILYETLLVLLLAFAACCCCCCCCCCFLLLLLLLLLLLACCCCWLLVVVVVVVIGLLLLLACCCCYFFFLLFFCPLLHCVVLLLMLLLLLLHCGRWVPTLYPVAMSRTGAPTHSSGRQWGRVPSNQSNPPPANSDFPPAFPSTSLPSSTPLTPPLLQSIPLPPKMLPITSPLVANAL